MSSAPSVVRGRCTILPVEQATLTPAAPASTTACSPPSVMAPRGVEHTFTRAEIEDILLEEWAEFSAGRGQAHRILVDTYRQRVVDRIWGKR